MTAAACGGGGGSENNDQGVSFRALGVFQETQEQVAPAADTLPSIDNAVGDSGRIIILGQTTTVPNDLNGDGDLDGGFLGFQNLIDRERVNVTGVRIEVFIPGASIPNPVLTDFVPVAVALGPALTDEDETNTSIAFVQTIFLPADAMAFITQNQGLWPPTPFNMNIVMTVTATADNGDDFDSNTFTYGVDVVAPDLPL
jgi:hypothetical protein